MVFPSLSFSVDTGLISQMSTITVIAFSIFLNYWKKTVKVLASISLVAFAVGALVQSAFGFGFVPGSCGTQCRANQNYYNTPIYYNKPVYYYPDLQYHSFWGPTPSYFRSHDASPYAPNWYYNCPNCNRQYQMNQRFPQVPGWNNLFPQNNNQYHGPGMPAS